MTYPDFTLADLAEGLRAQHEAAQAHHHLEVQAAYERGRMHALQRLSGLAFAIFQTSPRVVSQAKKRAEGRAERIPEILLRMWERDEAGWATEARDRAKKILEVL